MQFLMQIVVEEFLEDINNMLNSGEVPNLFAADEYELIITRTRPSAKDRGISEGDRYKYCMPQMFWPSILSRGDEGDFGKGIHTPRVGKCVI